MHERQETKSLDRILFFSLDVELSHCRSKPTHDRQIGKTMTMLFSTTRYCFATRCIFSTSSLVSALIA